MYNETRLKTVPSLKNRMNFSIKLIVIISLFQLIKSSNVTNRTTKQSARRRNALSRENVIKFEKWMVCI